LVVSLLYLLFRRALAVAALRLRSGEFKELKRAIIRVAVSGNSVVLVDETSELVAADLPAGRSCLLLGLGRAELERTMRPLGVVVVDVDAQHPFEVAAVQDQQPVETVGARRAESDLRLPLPRAARGAARERAARLVVGRSGSRARDRRGRRQGGRRELEGRQLRLLLRRTRRAIVVGCGG
jgi:hypothetical protein